MQWMPYAVIILWRDKGRYYPAVLAVAFSALLIAIQGGLLFGILDCVSVPIDYARADLWITTSDTESINQSRPIPKSWLLRLAGRPEVVRTEDYILASGHWHKPNMGSSEVCILVGSRLDKDSLGVVRQIPDELRARLAEPGTIVVDEGDLPVLGLKRGVGEVAEINGKRVRIVGTIRSIQGLDFAWIYCSLETAREVLPQFAANRDQMQFGLASCHSPEEAEALARELRETYKEEKMGVFTRSEFSRRVRHYWLFRSKGGVVLVLTLVLASFVGIVITRQTLYAAALAAKREYAMLDALGIAREQLVGLVMAQSFWIGMIGFAIAGPLMFLISTAAQLVGARVLFDFWLVALTVAMTMGVALWSGAGTLKLLRDVDPAMLLR